MTIQSARNYVNRGHLSSDSFDTLAEDLKKLVLERYPGDSNMYVMLSNLQLIHANDVNVLERKVGAIITPVSRSRIKSNTDSVDKSDINARDEIVSLSTRLKSAENVALTLHKRIAELQKEKDNLNKQLKVFQYASESEGNQSRQENQQSPHQVELMYTQITDLRKRMRATELRHTKQLGSLKSDFDQIVKDKESELSLLKEESRKALISIEKAGEEQKRKNSIRLRKDISQVLEEFENSRKRIENIEYEELEENTVRKNLRDGNFLHTKERYKEALEILENILSSEIFMQMSKSFQSDVYGEIAGNYYMTEDLGLAKSYYEKALECDDSSHSCFANLSLIALSSKDLQEAQENIERALILCPNNEMYMKIEQKIQNS